MSGVLHGGDGGGGNALHPVDGVCGCVSIQAPLTAQVAGLAACA